MINLVKNIKGFQQLSLMEWRGVVCAIFFLGGCNFRCIYCHNHEIAFNPKNISSKDFNEILKIIEDKKDWLDGIVVSGGEPTIYGEELIDFLSFFKKKKLKTKLFTNGYNIDIINEIISKNLIDEISMDIKHLPYKYREIVMVDFPDLEEKINEAVNIVKKAPISKEFRLTVVKGIHSLEEIKKVRELLSPEKLILQNVRTSDIPYYAQEIVLPFTEEEIKEIEKIL